MVALPDHGCVVFRVSGMGISESSLGHRTTAIH